MPNTRDAVQVILDGKYAGQYDEIFDGAWTLVQGTSVAVLMAVTKEKAEHGYGYIRITVPLAIGVPPSPGLDACVARLGRDWEVGRFYIYEREDWNSVMVVAEEFLPGVLFDEIQASSLQFLRSMVGSMLALADAPTAGALIRARFGGRPLDPTTEAPILFY